MSYAPLQEEQGLLAEGMSSETVAPSKHAGTMSVQAPASAGHDNHNPRYKISPQPPLSDLVPDVWVRWPTDIVAQCVLG